MADQITFVTNQRRLKSHQKSRGGCFRCKTKRIKCNESTPQCTACLKHAAQCVYPGKKPDLNVVQLNPLGFHLHDMRLFHDFMTASWPHLPLERDDAWRHEIPIVAQQHEFLMHGILSLGAAHLHTKTSLDLKDSVDRHRMLAMRGLNSVSSAIVESNQVDDAAASQLTAILAAAYVLTFTASYMGDSFSVFLVFVRACSSITKQIIQAGLPSPLLPWNERSTTSAPHLDVMRQRLRNASSLPENEVECALASLQNVERGCFLLPFQQDMLHRMKAIFTFAHQPHDAYRHFVDIYTSLTDMPAEEFAIFTDTTNIASMVLQAHFLAIEALLHPWLTSELGDRSQYGKRDSMSALPPPVSLCEDGVPAELSRWPLRFLGRKFNK